MSFIEIQYRELKPGQMFWEKSGSDMGKVSFVLLKDNDFVLVSCEETITMLKWENWVSSDDPTVVVWFDGSPDSQAEVHIIENVDSGIIHLTLDERPICGHRFNKGTAIIDDFENVSCQHCKELQFMEIWK